MPRRLHAVVWSAMLAPILALVAFAAPGTSVADPWQVRTWQTSDGLPDNNITAIEQSADGYLLVATMGGLMRFDGVRFEELPTGHLAGVPSSAIRTMTLGGSGRLWLAMDLGGIVRVQDRSARIFNEESGLGSMILSRMVEDREGVLWATSKVNNLVRIEGETVTHAGRNFGLPPQGYFSLALDRSGEVWLSRASSLGVLLKDHWQSRQVFRDELRLCAAQTGGLWIHSGGEIFRLRADDAPEPVAQLPKNLVVSVLMEDRTGALWIGTEADGLWRLHEGQVTPVAVSHPEITTLYEDREGNVWVGTAGGGLNQLRPRAMEMVSPSSGPPWKSVRSLCVETDGTVWVVLHNGALGRSKGGEWQIMSRADGWPSVVSCVAAAREGGVWIGISDGRLRRWSAGRTEEWRPRNEPGPHQVRSLLEASNGDVWFSTDSGTQLHVLRAGSIKTLTIPPNTRAIRALAETADGVIWAGSMDGKLLRIEGDQAVNQPGAWPDKPKPINCLAAASDGSLLVGYAESGVGRWAGGRYSRIGKAQGLHDDRIHQILDDGRGHVWFLGNRGFFRARTDDLLAVMDGRQAHLHCIAYQRDAGLPNLQPVSDNTPTTGRAPDGRLLFSTRNGLLVVTPDKLRNNETPLPVMVTRIRVDDRLVAAHDSRSPLRSGAGGVVEELQMPRLKTNLAPEHGKVEIDFTTLSFSSPENVHFRHRLKGFDTEWVNIGPQRTVKYPRLPAGDYEFEVTASNESGVWNESSTSLAFTVRPHLWQTWWFRLGSLVLFTASVIGLVRYVSTRRLRRELDLQKERSRIARDMHDSVGAKLSRLSLLSYMTCQQPDLSPETREEVAEISETAQDTIRSFEEVVWAVNPKNNSLADLANYLCRFAERMFHGTATQCVFDLPAEIPKMKLPAHTRHEVLLAAKEALNNALKHAEAQQVTVSLRVTSAEFEIVIEDDGRGFAAGSASGRLGGGNGLENMQERMHSIRGRLEIDSRPGEGTRVVLHVPCTKRK